jgi:hypothetical protein
MQDHTKARKHLGSCHCGDNKFEAIVDASAGSQCNCTVCTKLGATTTIIKPAAFKLLTDPAKLASYSRMPEIANRYFCARCHGFVYSAGNIPEIGGEFVSVPLNVLDDIDLIDVAVTHWDGRHDNWQAGPSPKRVPVSLATATAAERVLDERA